jgi:hypothetical protein
VEGSRNSLFILSIGASFVLRCMNAAVIASVHVGVRLPAKPPVTEQNLHCDSPIDRERSPRF